MSSKVFQFQKSKKCKRITYMSRANLLLAPNIDDSKLKSLFYSFCDCTNVNGFYYLRKGKTSGKARIFWIIVPLIMLVFAGVLIYLLDDAYDNNGTFINLYRPKFTSQGGFPGVTICPNEPVLLQKISRLVETSKIPSDQNRESVELAIKSLNEFMRRPDTLSKEDVLIMDEFATQNNLSLIDILKATEMDCDDFITKFRYGDALFNCTKGYCPGWRKIRSFYGTCCSYNYHPNNKCNASVLNQAEKLSGMSILFSRPGYSTGVKLLLSQPGSYITHFTDSFSVIPEFDNYFRIYLINEILTAAFQNLPLKHRRCMQPGDMDNFMYIRSRCILVCTAEAMYRECGCHPYFIPSITEISKTHRNCTVNDLLCFKYETVIWNAACYHCLPTCKETKYRITSSLGALEYKASKATLSIYENISQYENPFTANIFYGRQTTKVFQRHATYSWINLLSNLGGILNLTLGVSLISSCEIIYYLFYKSSRLLLNHRR